MLNLPPPLSSSAATAFPFRSLLMLDLLLCPGQGFVRNILRSNNKTQFLARMAAPCRSMSSATVQQNIFPFRDYRPTVSSWPYTDADFSRQDEADDAIFYQPARLVTHIDGNAISSLSRYYSTVLPTHGRILELCSSWVSHFPSELAEAAQAGVLSRDDHVGGSKALQVIGYGMNADELDANPVLSKRIVQDLNTKPSVKDESVAPIDSFDAALCVVSIDYLTKPLEVLGSVLDLLKPGARIHLAISNRCFPSKVVSRWLRIGEKQRLEMVGDYLWFSGFRDIQIVQVVDNSVTDETSFAGWFGATKDPLWVVRGSKLNT